MNAAGWRLCVQPYVQLLRALARQGFVHTSSCDEWRDRQYKAQMSSARSFLACLAVVQLGMSIAQSTITQCSAQRKAISYTMSKESV